MSSVESCADNAAVEGFCGRPKSERVNRRVYPTRADARADVFDYIERVHNPRKRRRLTEQGSVGSYLTKPSIKTG